MIQTWAIFKDAYRELNARKMFWVSLGIAGLVVSVFAIFGMNERGIQILWFTLDTDVLNTKVFPKETIYKVLFAIIGVNLWLGWLSTILALVSTASVIPDFVASGAIENMLARPIGRVRLFLTKYAASLLFVVLQALVFTLLAVLIIGVRSGEWLWSLLYAVPMVTVFFSYLYSVSALVGVWTRSTIASLVAALVLWGLVLGVSLVHTFVMLEKLKAEDPLPLKRTKVAALQLQINSLPPNPQTVEESDRVANLKKSLADSEVSLKELEASSEKWTSWYRVTHLAHAILPKCGETKSLMVKWSDPEGEIGRFLEAMGPSDRRPPPRKIQRQMEQVLDAENTVWYVVGTSLVFEGLVLAAACTLFARRDF